MRSMNMRVMVNLQILPNVPEFPVTVNLGNVIVCRYAVVSCVVYPPRFFVDLQTFLSRTERTREACIFLNRNLLYAML